jgi:hypothetical protein
LRLAVSGLEAAQALAGSAEWAAKSARAGRVARANTGRLWSLVRASQRVLIAGAVAARTQQLRREWLGDAGRRRVRAMFRMESA